MRAQHVCGLPPCNRAAASGIVLSSTRERSAANSARIRERRLRQVALQRLQIGEAQRQQHARGYAQRQLRRRKLVCVSKRQHVSAQDEHQR
jgi:hypothetical protein